MTDDIDDIDAARAVATETMAMYDRVPSSVPSSQRINAREGVRGVVDLALIGSPDDVARGLARYIEAGATDLVLMPIQTGRVELQRVSELATGIPTDG